MTVKLIYPDGLMAEVLRFGITEAQVNQTWDHPDKVQYIKDNDGKILSHLFLKLFAETGREYAIITHGHWLSPGNYEFRRIYKVYSNICDSFKDKHPSELLYHLAERFGNEITVSGVRQKFFFLQEVPIDPGTAHSIMARDQIDIADLISEPKDIQTYRESLSEGFVAIYETDGRYVAKCMLIFAVTLSQYLKHLGRAA